MERLIIDILLVLVAGTISFEAGNRMALKDAVLENTCKERREGCVHTVAIQVQNLADKVEELCDAMYKK